MYKYFLKSIVIPTVTAIILSERLQRDIERDRKS